MNALTGFPIAEALYPIWEDRGAGYFTLRLNEHASFGGGTEGSAYYVTLPGRSLRKCWNRAEVERVCRDYYEQMLAEQVEQYENGEEW